VPCEAGVRAQLLRPDGQLEDDFLIVEAPGAIHVCNAPSPAATASLEIGRTIAAMIVNPALGAPAPAATTTASDDDAAARRAAAPLPAAALSA
jgi:(S)-2-hydroxyglutarate dehydrogenase